MPDVSSRFSSCPADEVAKPIFWTPRCLLFNSVKCPAESQKCPAELKSFFIITSVNHEMVLIDYECHVSFLTLIELETDTGFLFINFVTAMTFQTEPFKSLNKYYANNVSISFSRLDTW